VTTPSPDPFLTYNFRVKWDGSYVAAVTTVSGLTRQTDYQPVRLEHGITTDSAFQDWANMMWSYPNTQELGDEMSMATFRRPMQIEVYDQLGALRLRYNLYNCWPSEYTALPELNSDANVVALASMTIEHEGWDRDMSADARPGAQA
jgi:phage tail-like protein